jgi:hypothetical protein
MALSLMVPAAIKWALWALLLAGVMALAFIGALFLIVCAAIFRNRYRAARAERPEWLPQIEPMPEVEPVQARIERLRREMELSAWPKEIDHGVESETKKT